MDAVEEIVSFRKESLVPKIDENCGDSMDSSDPPRVKLLSLLDDIENRVERFRRGALYMEEERDCLFTSIDAIRTSDLVNDLGNGEKQDIFEYVERVSSRCATVEITVRTERNESQEESLFQVNTYINDLIMSLKDDPFSVKDRCVAYMAACGSTNDAFDKNFESALLGCALDDQKRIRRRLQGLLNYIDSNYEVTPASDAR